MDVSLKYLGQSNFQQHGDSATVSWAPNLARDPVAFDAALKQPLRFREAMSALHDVVISDLRHKPRDKSDYEAWKQQQRARDAAAYQAAREVASQEILAKAGVDVPRDLVQRHNKLVREYWSARMAYNRYLLAHNRDLWRLLMPCDPVITVADDVVFFECFSADESSYGCLTVDREDGFSASASTQNGTTNVDYSWDLYNQFQGLRSYRETRCQVDPEGFDVKTTGQADYREEKIDLPDGWLRGFMQIQGAMSLPMRKVSLSREAVYNVLTFLKRNKAKKSPRALRFELLPGKAPRLVLEPWEQVIESHGTVYDGPPTEPIRIWGRQRLLVLSRLLPLAEGFDVYLLGTGFPTFWVARLGEMRLTLGLSGWTQSDWTRAAAIDLLAPPASPTENQLDEIATILQKNGQLSLKHISLKSRTDDAVAAAALNHLANSGQVIRDLHDGVYRWRQVMPRALGEAELGPEHPELSGSRSLRMTVASVVEVPRVGRLVSGSCQGTQTEMLLDGDGLIRRGKCGCTYYRKFGIKQGPCRHMLALRKDVLNPDPSGATADMKSWFGKLSFN